MQLNKGCELQTTFDSITFQSVMPWKGIVILNMYTFQ